MRQSLGSAEGCVKAGSQDSKPDMAVGGAGWERGRGKGGDGAGQMPGAPGMLSARQLRP